MTSVPRVAAAHTVVLVTAPHRTEPALRVERGRNAACELLHTTTSADAGQAVNK